ncbi:MAG: low-CO2-inducible protein [Monoraphidium minutum]|nr:MAG: low-CO2-inducible protein [Monoraphidium minutum]
MQLLNAHRHVAAAAPAARRAASVPALQRRGPASRRTAGAAAAAPADAAEATLAVAAAPAVDLAALEAAATAAGLEFFETTSRDAYYTRRHELVLSHFPGALGVDDFMARVEVALAAHGFRGDNSIAMTNLCRDEVTTIVKDKIESVFGSSFNTNGLGAVLTCGVTGIGAGLSHSPLCPEDGRERYVFFSFPHTAIDEGGELGAITRPNRPGESCACGALAKALKELQVEGLQPNCRVPGVHDPIDPEYSILKQRLARRIRYERLNPEAMSLPDMTSLAERVITDDLEYLIEKCVDIEKADYAVVTGVQIHNWSRGLGGDNFEFVAPTKVYVVNKGQITVLDLNQLPALTPRQVGLLADPGLKGAPAGFSSAEVPTALQSLPAQYLAARICSSAPVMEENYRLEHKPFYPVRPAGSEWAPIEVKPREGVRELGMPTMEGEEAGEAPHPLTSFRTPKGVTRKG